ncbi:hypothetical protein [Haloarchaeobius baliensis]|uniref:hypothetical protein n=1 Tax=Haloarchaeobius baliensis TaxID=1670458 RepID=UPI003F880301
MTRNTVNTTVSLRPADAVFLEWASGVNASGLFREELADQMAYRGIDRRQLVSLVDQALDAGADLDDLLEQTTDMDDLEALLDTNKKIDDDN